MSEAGWKKTSQLQPSLAAGGRPSGIFISHATADKELVDALVDLLQTGIGVPHDQIFCTSLEGHGIPEGEDFADFIRDKLQGAGHVIMVITPRYYESAFCLCELGATWIQSGSAFPLIVPPLGFSDMKAVLSGVQAGLINDASKLDNLRDRLGSSVPTAKWNAKRDVFLQTFDQRLAGSIKGPTKIPSEKFKELNEKYAALLDEVSVKENEIRTLNQQIADLKALRDRSEVAKVVAKYSDEEERFDALIKKVADAFKRVPDIVVEALYYDERGEPFVIKTGFDRDQSKIDEAKAAHEDGFIEYRDGDVSLNHDDRKVRRASDALAELREFLSGGASSDFFERFEDENEFAPDLGNHRFWNNYLGL